MGVAGYPPRTWRSRSGLGPRQPFNDGSQPSGRSSSRPNRCNKKRGEPTAMSMDVQQTYNKRVRRVAPTVERILVIDDERRMCESIRILLEKEGYRVVTAGDGAEGIEILKEQRFSLVIVDLMMPKVDGFEVLSYVRRNLPQTLVIVITGYSSMRSSIEALRGGAYDYLTKPFDFDIFKLTVEKALDKLRIQRLNDEFISMITHDLKNPLTSIIGYCSLLLSGAYGEVVEAMQPPLKGINTNAERLLDLINDFLVVNKISAEGLKLEKQSLKLNNLLQHLADSVQAQMEIKKIKLELGLDSDIPSVECDPLQIERVVNNLLSNAIKFTPLGGHIGITSGYDDDWIWFSVSDSGPGIEPEKQQSIFEKYSRVDRKVEGTGLGLFITKSIVDLHQGTIDVESTLGEGASFTVHLPRHPAQNDGEANGDDGRPPAPA
ncbi:MAG: response regulator [Candidatus Coatesbacteria bacterium]|nr:response regulator [Candidatus Coatesbacteria bacterium]